MTSTSLRPANNRCVRCTARAGSSPRSCPEGTPACRHASGERLAVTARTRLASSGVVWGRAGWGGGPEWLLGLGYKRVRHAASALSLGAVRHRQRRSKRAWSTALWGSHKLRIMECEQSRQGHAWLLQVRFGAGDGGARVDMGEGCSVVDCAASHAQTGAGGYPLKIKPARASSQRSYPSHSRVTLPLAGVMRTPQGAPVRQGGAVLHRVARGRRVVAADGRDDGARAGLLPIPGNPLQVRTWACSLMSVHLTLSVCTCQKIAWASSTGAHLGLLSYGCALYSSESDLIS